MARRQCIVSGDDGLGNDIGHRRGENVTVLTAAAIGVGERPIRFQQELSLASSITAAPRSMHVCHRTPPFRDCTENAGTP